MVRVAACCMSSHAIGAHARSHSTGVHERGVRWSRG